MPTVLLIRSPNSTVPIEKSLVFKHDSLTVGRGGNDIQFAHKPEDNGISLTVLTLEENASKDDSIKALYHGEEEAFLDGNRLSTGEAFQWSNQSLIIHGKLGEYKFFLRDNKASWRFDLKAAKPNFCRILDKSDLAKPLLPGESVNFKIEVSDYKYDSNAPDDLWLQPSNIESPIRLELANLPVWNGHDGNPDEKLHKNAKRLHVPKPVNSIEPSFSLELPLLIPAGTKADRYTIELWVCSKVKGYQSLKVDLTVAPEYSFTSSFDPIGDVENYSKGVPYLKPGRSARLSITNNANKEQTFLLDWIIERSDKSGTTKIIHPLAGKTKTIESRPQGNGESFIEVQDLHWQSWLARPWLVWPWRTDERILLKIQDQHGSNVKTHPFIFKKDTKSGIKAMLLFTIFGLFLLVLLIPGINNRYHINVKQISACDNPYNDGAPVEICVADPTNVAYIALIPMQNGTPTPLKTLGATRESEKITNTYLLPTEVLLPTVSEQSVMIQADSGFAIPWAYPNGIICNQQSTIANLFCTSITQSVLISYTLPFPTFCVEFLSSTKCDGEPLNIMAWYEEPGKQIRTGNLSFTIQSSRAVSVSLIPPEGTPIPFNGGEISLPANFGDRFDVNGAPNPVSVITYSIRIKGIEQSNIITVNVIQPWVKVPENAKLFQRPYISEPMTVIADSNLLIALSRPMHVESETGNRWVKVLLGANAWWIQLDSVAADKVVDLDLLPESVVPDKPPPTITPTPPTPEPTSTPEPTFTTVPTPIPPIDFILMEDLSGKKANNSALTVEIFICVCSSDGNFLDGYSLKLTKPDGVSNILEVPSIPATLPEALEPQTWKFNLKFAQDFVVGTWWVQLMKDSYPVSEPTAVDFVASDAANGKLPWLYLRYCKGGTTC